MSPRFLILVSILLSLNVYIASHIIRQWPVAGHHLFLAWCIAAVFVILQILPFVGWLPSVTHRDKRISIGVQLLRNWIPYLGFGLFSCLLVYTFAADILSLSWQFFAMPLDLAAFNLNMLIALSFVTFVTFFIGVAQAVRGPNIVSVKIMLDKLPPNFEGFKIAQISDLHAGSTITSRYIRHVVDMVNSLKPDLIVLTGDTVEGSVKDLSADVSLLSKLKAPYGRYLVTGNHEYYWGADEWIKTFRKFGLHVLLNEHVMITREDEKIALAGVTDYSTRHMRSSHASNPARAMENVDKNVVKLILAHQPATYRMAQEAGADLMLSGHTHGGQYFPFSLFIRFFQKHYRGLSRHKNMAIYVSRGTGYWGPPLRTFVPAEVTEITLHRK